MNTFLQILFVLSLFLITACSSSYVVSSSGENSSVDEFNKLAEGEEAEIILTNNVEITATEVYLSSDSLYWFNPETELKTGVVKSEVRKITFTDDLRGGLEGAGIGLLSGGSAGLLFGVLTVEAAEANQTVGWCAAWSFIGGVVGALVGFPIGMINGHTYEYEFQNAEQ